MSSEQHFIRYSLETIPELRAWQTALPARDMLVQPASHGRQDIDDFVSKTVPMVAQDLPSGYSKSGSVSPMLLQLKHKGYSNEMLAEAFAFNWLTGGDVIYLPKLKSNLANNGWVRHAPPVILTLVLAIKMIYLAVAFLGPNVVTFIYASPGFVLVPAIPVYLLLRYLWLKAVPRLFKSGGVRYPDAMHPQRTQAQQVLAERQVYIQKKTEADAANTLMTFVTPEILPMFQQFEVVSPKQHGALYCSMVSDYRFAEKTTYLPVSPQEVGRLVHHYPLVFSNQGSLEIMALMGLSGTNRYCASEGEWLAPVKPKRLEHYPFALASTEQQSETDKQQEERILVLDPEAPQLNRYEEGEALFDLSDQMMPWLQKKQAALVDWNRQCLQSRPLLAELESQEVLTTAPLTLQQDGEARTLNGLRRVDLEKVKALDDATLARWARNGLLQVAYLQLASLEHLDQLLD